MEIISREALIRPSRGTHATLKEVLLSLIFSCGTDKVISPFTEENKQTNELKS